MQLGELGEQLRALLRAKLALPARLGGDLRLRRLFELAAGPFDRLAALAQLARGSPECDRRARAPSSTAPRARRGAVRFAASSFGRRRASRARVDADRFFAADDLQLDLQRLDPPATVLELPRAPHAG